MGGVGIVDRILHDGSAGDVGAQVLPSQDLTEIAVAHGNGRNRLIDAVDDPVVLVPLPVQEEE